MHRPKNWKRKRLRYTQTAGIIAAPILIVIGYMLISGGGIGILLGFFVSMAGGYEIVDTIRVTKELRRMRRVQ